MNDETTEITLPVINSALYAKPTDDNEITEQDLPPLNTRQQAMLNYIIMGHSNTKAYLLAGYDSIDHAAKAAFELTNRPPLKTHLDYFRAKNSKAITKEWKAQKLQQIIDMALDPDNPLANPDYAIKAMAELNKMQGDYPQQNISINNINTTLEDIRRVKAEYVKDR